MKVLLLLTALTLTACASTPPPRQAPPRATESAWVDAAAGLTLGLLLGGMAWNFIDVPRHGGAPPKPKAAREPAGPVDPDPKPPGAP